jgi:hypothetical protein
MLRSAEEEEADVSEKKETYNAKTVLKAKEASPGQFALLFVGMARALGADANVVFGVDRTDRFWNKGFKSMEQFSYIFVAVRAPGEPDDKLVFVGPGSGLPYGVLPWRTTGTTALMFTAKGGLPVVVPAAAAAVNREDTHASLSFSDDNETTFVRWDRSSAGSAGADSRSWLRGLDARERKETLEGLCGASGSIEVTGAELPGLDDGTAPFRIACELEEPNTSMAEGNASFSVPWTGPWWPPAPEFAEVVRVHPVVFDYPKVEIVVVDISAAHGFKPKEAPAPVKLETPYGRYLRFVTTTPKGYRVDRLFALTTVAVATNEYDALRKFLDDVKRADQTRVTFERIGDAK